MAPELIAALEALLAIGVDVKKGMKAGSVVSALMSDAELMSKLEIVLKNLGALPADVRELSAADIMPVLNVAIPGIQKIIEA